MVNASTGTVFVQNKTINLENTILGNKIMVGSNVTNTLPAGPVYITMKRTTLIGQDVELQGGTTVGIGAELEIRNE